MKCAVTGRPYTVFGYKGKQVRDNIHSYDLVQAFWHFYRAPRVGEVYNIGGGPQSNCSMLEAISIVERLTDRPLSWTYSDTNRAGDHVWWVSDIRKFAGHYPGWSLTLLARQDDRRDSRRHDRTRSLSQGPLMPLEVRSLAEWEADGVPGLLSVVIPAHNEEGRIGGTVRDLYRALHAAGIPHEVLVVNDNSHDGTERVLDELRREVPTLRYINNSPPNGFGFAVRAGLVAFKGDAIAIVMADASDSPTISSPTIERCRMVTTVCSGHVSSRAPPSSITLAQAGDEPAGEFLYPVAVLDVVQRRHECLQALPTRRHRRRAAAARVSLQPDRRAPAQGHRPRATAIRCCQRPGITAPPASRSSRFARWAPGISSSCCIAISKSTCRERTTAIGLIFATSSCRSGRGRSVLQHLGLHQIAGVSRLHHERIKERSPGRGWCDWVGDPAISALKEVVPQHGFRLARFALVRLSAWLLGSNPMHVEWLRHEHGLGHQQASQGKVPSADVIELAEPADAVSEGTTEKQVSNTDGAEAFQECIADRREKLDVVLDAVQSISRGQSQPRRRRRRGIERNSTRENTRCGSRSAAVFTQA